MHTLVCFGDSITESGSSPNGWCTQLQQRFEAASPGATRVVVAGFGGRQSGELLDRMGEHVLPHLPATVLIATGINDAYHQAWQRIPRVSLAEFHRNLAEIVRIVRERGGKPVLIAGHELVDRGIFVQGNGRPQPENYAPYHAAIVALAAEIDVPLLDIAAAVRARGLDPASLLADDGVHLSASGHDAYAAIVVDFLPSIPA
jgi:lysophospholipase L1-like esterase